jgi:hypothetical protein
MGKFILALEIFVFVMACLNILTNIYNFVKIWYTENGKYEGTKTQSLLLGSSIAYVITMTIVGF